MASPVQMTLIAEVKSGKGELYAKAGTQVTIIRISEPAVIVEANGKRFTTNVNNLKDGTTTICNDSIAASNRG